MGDLDNEDFGASASIAISPDEWYDSEGDIDESLETEGSIFITTLDLDDDIFNTWKFGESGNLVFPDGTYFGKVEGPGTIGFEIEDDSDFFILTGDEMFKWTFTNDGELLFPGGTLFGAGEDANTIGFVTQEYSDFFILTGDEEFEWVFKNDGSLNFPDGTTFNYVPEVGTVGFTSTDNTDFIIATSNNNNDYEWQFTKNGEFKLPGLTGSDFPGPASFQMIDDAPFSSPVALEITSPNALVIKSPTKTWNFEANGNTTFPADFAVVGDLKIGTENIFDKFVTDNFIFNSSQLGIYSVNATYNFTLSATPRPLSAVAMYFNGSRVNPDRYVLNGRSLTYTKPENESAPTAVIVQFDYIKN
jgi:hypothetical protein